MEHAECEGIAMELHSITSRQQNEVTMEGAARVKMRMLIGPEQGATNFHMRHFQISPGGHTPHHQHDHEHEVLILAGAGTVRSKEGNRPFKRGDVIFVPPNEEHQFINSGDDPCEFICLIPTPQSCCN